MSETSTTTDPRVLTGAPAAPAPPAADPPREFDPPRRDCPGCGGAALARYDHDLHGRRIDRCARCSLLFLNPVYSDADLVRFYGRYVALDAPPAPPGERVPWRVRPDVRGEGKRRLFQLARSLLGNPGRALAVGCGDGLELEIGRDLGFAMEGYDVDPKVTTELARRHGVPVHGGAFASLPVAPGAFDLVVMDQVLEHVKEPLGYVRKAAELLRPGGVLLLAVPNVGSLSNRAKTFIGCLGLRPRRRGKHYNTRHHVLFFTPRSLRALVRHAGGLQVLRLRASLKPQRNPLSASLARCAPFFDSGMLLVGRRVQRPTPIT